MEAGGPGLFHLGVAQAAFRADAEGLYGGSESIRVQCPRCAATHVLTREAMEAYVAQTAKPGA